MNGEKEFQWPEQFMHRAKRIDTGEWMMGYLWRGADQSYMIPHNAGIVYKDTQLSAVAREIDPDTICRYIACHGGDVIWEHDVVRCYGGECCQGFWEFDKVMEANSLDWDFIWNIQKSERVKVLGNTIDQPELAPHFQGGQKEEEIGR